MRPPHLLAPERRTPSTRSSDAPTGRLHRPWSCLAAVVAIGSATVACGGEQAKPKTVVAPQPIADAAPVAVVDAVPLLPAEAGPPAAADTAGVWSGMADAAELTPAVSPSDCWKGFAPTGNAVADVNELGRRCAMGMTQILAPVKHTFRAGESKSIPMPFVPGCYRIIAVGGTGVKDVNLMLRDNAGKIVAADLTPDDVFPMINPKNDFCSDAVQILNFVIEVKKGSGEVAGAVWKR